MRSLTFYFLLLTSYYLLPFTETTAQTEIPIGSWRMHLSYNSIKTVANGGNKIYGGAESGIVIFDRSDKSFSTYNTLNGLSSTGISHLAYATSTQQLIVAYNDGNLDILKNDEVFNFNRLKTSTSVTGSKKINHISTKGDFAYLSADYGVVVFDLQRLELKETWRDIGKSGSLLKIFQSAILGDSIFLATEKGILAGDLRNNLLDFNNWKRFDTGNFVGPINSITAFNNTIYASVNGSGIFRHQGSGWIKESFLQNLNFNFMQAPATHLLIGENSNLWKLTASGILSQIVTDKITYPLITIEDAQQKLWIGDKRNGLLSDLSGGFESHLPNGPTFASAYRLKYFNNIMYAVAGGFTTAGLPSGNTEDLNFFENGMWEVIPKSFNDLTDVDFLNSKLYVSSFGSGVEESGDVNSIVFDETNSPLQNINPPAKSVYISAIVSSADGLWVANYGANQPLHLLKPDHTWESFSFSLPQAKYVTDLAVDLDGNVWMTINPAQGGGIIIFNKKNNTTLFRSEVSGNGALPNRLVNAVTVDRDGNVWVGTDEGVAYFFSATNDAVKPIFENRFLLKDEKITAIEVDGGNRKWIGTENGAWLFNTTGEQLIHNFTEANSPLLSNTILDIEINDNTGEVFFATDKGIISYRADATASQATFEKVKVFPNPVTSDFSGTVGITGLATDAFVKITDVSGKLIWQTQANGGTATWNVRDYNGRKASTGIYLVFAATQDGSESVVAKIAVIE